MGDQLTASKEDADFGGYVTRVGRKCSDGRTILSNAFKHHDGEIVPLVWSHGHNDPELVLGHTLLEHRDDGVYGYSFFNDTVKGQTASRLVQHGDVKALSIFANQLVQKGMDVVHGNIREVSLVLAGANPGAFIDNIRHGGTSYGEIIEDEAVISANEPLEMLSHAEGDDNEDGDEETQEVWDSMSPKQQDLVVAMLAKVAGDNADGDDSDDSSDDSDDSNTDAQHSGTASDTDGGTNADVVTHTQEGSTNMARNTFDSNSAAAGDSVSHSGTDSSAGTYVGGTLTHSQLTTLVEEGKRLGSFKEAILQHAGEWGINNIEALFPDAKAIDAKPEWITRKIEWVEAVLNATRKLPFSRIKSLSADLTHEEARAKGYIKGNVKKEQFFAIQSRETTPKTIYKKQRLDRDDIIDITEFDVVAWLWVEMRFMLREEAARAVLIGDGRDVADPDKIDENKIRPIAKDNEFYTDEVIVPNVLARGELVEEVLRARDAYKGSGQPTAYMTNATYVEMLLERDDMGRRLYRNKAELASELDVRDIVTVPVMEGATRLVDEGTAQERELEILILLVNLSDYSVGSTKGGELSTFSDFDLDVNQEKYLIEGRMSGALTKHKTAQVIVRENAV